MGVRGPGALPLSRVGAAPQSKCCRHALLNVDGDCIWRVDGAKDFIELCGVDVPDFPPIAAPDREDILYIVDDPGGVPANKKIELQNLQADIGARVRHSVHTVIGTGSLIALAFDTETYDTDGIHSLVANTERLTCQTDGKYFICGNIAWGGNTTGVRFVGIRLNGGSWLATEEYEPESTVEASQCVTDIWNLSVSDYVELVVYQDSGGNLNLLGATTAQYSPEFMMQRIG